MRRKWITEKVLKGLNTCAPGIRMFNEKYKKVKITQLISDALESDSECVLEYANWIIVRCMNYKQYVAYAIYAAEQALQIYEAQYPNNDTLRKKIEIAKICLKNPTVKNKKNVVLAYSTSNTGYSIDAAVYDADDYAVYAVYAAVYTAAYADDAVAGYTAGYAVDSSVNKIKMFKKILRYGLELIEEK